MDRAGMIKAIWAISGSLGISKEVLYEALTIETGKEHMRECTDSELQAFLKVLDTVKVERRVRVGRATDKQLNYIKWLERQIGWAEDPKHLRNYIKKYAKIDFLEWLTPKQASNIIIGLQKIKEKMESDKLENEMI